MTTTFIISYAILLVCFALVSFWLWKSHKMIREFQDKLKDAKNDNMEKTQIMEKLKDEFVAQSGIPKEVLFGVGPKAKHDDCADAKAFSCHADMAFNDTKDSSKETQPSTEDVTNAIKEFYWMSALSGQKHSVAETLCQKVMDAFAEMMEKTGDCNECHYRLIHGSDGRGKEWVRWVYSPDGKFKD